jgi:hypothetical protein
LVEEVAATALRLEPTGRGLGWTLHALPFQRSINVRVPPVRVSSQPTAQALVEDVAATPLR